MKRLASLPVPTRALSVVSLVLLVLWLSPQAAPILTVGSYQLVSTKSAKQGQFDFTYRASVTNAGSAAANVSATLVSPPPGVVVIDGSLTFGSVPAGATVVSQDTFVIRQTKKAAIDPAMLQWIVQGTPANSQPTANAGPDQQSHVGVSVQLDGAASSDADGDTLAFAWSFVSRPAGSTASLNSPIATAPTFVPDRPGAYQLQVLVNDGITTSAPDFVTVTTVNRPPVADAGADQTGAVQNLVQLDGTQSSDPDGDQLTFQWSFVSKPETSAAELSDGAAVSPSFVLDLPGAYVVQLMVNDGGLSSAADTVTIDTSNSAPVAVAGPDQTAPIGATIHLDGSASSDIDGDELTFSWDIVSAPADSVATLSNPAVSAPTFVIDRPGEYVGRLVVDDGTASSQPSFVTITTTNSPPVANAGPNQTVPVTATVQLDGSGSTDVDGDGLTYAWSFTARPAGSGATLLGADSVSPSFVVDEAGTYVVQLAVNDGMFDSAPATVTVTTENSPPVASAGSDQTLLVGTSVVLDGAGSTDADGNALTYAWSLISRPPDSDATIQNAGNVVASFTLDKPGSYIAQLVVSDGIVTSAPDNVTISTVSSRPVAHAGPDQNVAQGATVQLDGAASSDADGEPLTYLWAILTKPAGSTAELSDTTVVNPTFDADFAGSYVVQLIVDDETLSSVPDTVSITVSGPVFVPTANAGVDQIVAVGGTAFLNGTASISPGGLPLTYSWSFISVPAGSATALSSGVAAAPTFVADVPGAYVVQLIVNNGTADSAPDIVVVSTPRQLSLSPKSVAIAPGGTASMTLSASYAGATGFEVLLTSSNTAVASVPAVVTIPAGQASVTFTVTAQTTNGGTIIHAAAGSASASAVASVGSRLVEWVSDANGFWDEGINWTGGVIPGAGDVVVIDRPAGAVVVTVRTITAAVDSLYATERLDVTGSLVVAETASIDGDLNLFGSLAGAGAVFLGSNMTWHSGTVSLGDGLEVLNGQTITFPNNLGGHLLANTSLRNHGTVAMGTGNTLTLQGAGTVAITNESDGTWTSNDSPISSNGAGTLTFANAGTLRKGSAGAALVLGGHIAYTNTGTIEVLGGGLHVLPDSGPGLTTSGQLTVAGGATFYLHRVTLAAGTTLSGAGTLAMNGITTVTAPITVPLTTVLTGAVTGSGTVNLDAAMTWQSGTIELAGGLEVLNGRTLTFPNNSATKVLAHTSLRNHGTVAMGSGNSLSLQGAGTVAITNQTDGLWTSTDSPISSNGAGALTFVNAGTLRKQGAGSALLLGGHIAFTNTGTIEVEGGELYVSGDGASASLMNSGQLIVAGSATFYLHRVTLAAGTTFSGAGTLAMNGVTTVTAPITLPVTTVLTGAVMGSGTLNLDAAMTWRSGTIELAGGLEVLNGRTLTFPNNVGVHVLANTSLRNHGTVAMGTGNSLGLQGAGTVAIVNETNGLWTSIDSPISSNGAGALTFVNAGTLRKQAGSALLLGGHIAFTNTGTIEVEGGELYVSGDGASASLMNSGHLAVAGGATFYLHRVTLAAGTTFSGAGTLAMNGVTTVTATITLPLTTVLTGAVTGAGTLNLDAAMTWRSGTIELAGGLEVLNGRTLTFPNNVGVHVLANTSLRNHGTVAMGTGNSLGLQGAGTVAITNQADGLWTSTDSPISSNGAGALTFVNAGTLRKQAGSALLLGGHIAFTNTGTIEVEGGELYVSGDGASATLMNSGHLAVAGGATFYLHRVTLAAGTTFSGAGTLVMNGITTVTAPITLPLTTVLTGAVTGSGTVYLDAAMTWPSGTIELAGGLEVLNGRTLTFPDNTGNRVMVNTSLRNYGTVAMGTGNALGLQGGGTGEVVNAAGGLWTLGPGTSGIGASGAPISGGAYLFRNLGTLQGPGSATTTLILGDFISFSNSGTVTGVTVLDL